LRWKVKAVDCIIKTLNPNNGGKMKFFKKFLINLIGLVILGFALYLYSPKIISQVYSFFGMMFGPVLVILMVIIAAIPQRRT
jgi:hypothetical protein